MKSERAIIVAYGDGNRVIGDRGQMPWMGKMPADLQRVRDLTSGQAIIMGLRTFESLGRPLPNRQNIVLSADEFKDERVDVAHNFDEAFSQVLPDRTAFIFGGASVYAQALEQDLVDVIYATEIHGQFDGDTFFPEVNICHSDSTGCHPELDSGSRSKEVAKGDIKSDWIPSRARNDSVCWREVERQDFPADEENLYPYSFVKYERIKDVKI